MNFGLPELNSDMAMSMAPSVQLTQTLPWPGKLGRQEQVAVFERDMAVARADEAWWQLRTRTAGVVYDLYSLDRRLDVMAETLELLRGFREVALSMYSTGRGRQTDVLRADVEIARTEGEIRRMEGLRVARAAVLNGILDRPPSEPVPSVALGTLPRVLPPTDTLLTWAREGRPLLREAELGVHRAASATARAARDIWPDLRLALAYGQRDRGFGTERMGSVMVGFTLPVFAGDHQHALRDAAAAEGRMAEAREASARAEVAAVVARLVAELDAARSLVDLYRDDVVPQARTNVESAFASYRAGAVDFLTLVDAQTTANRYEMELHQLVAGYGATLSALESTVGRALPGLDGQFLEGRCRPRPRSACPSRSSRPRWRSWPCGSDPTSPARSWRKGDTTTRR
jgi:outer membrane protein TolC